MSSANDTNSLRSEQALELESSYQQWLKDHNRMKDILPQAQDGRTYVKHAKNLLPLLVALAELHPITQAVVDVFKKVVDYEDDKDSDARVDSVYLVETDVLKTLFEIHKLLSRRTTRWDRDSDDELYANPSLSSLLRRIEKEINACANTADTYRSTKRLIKVCRLPEWKKLMTDHIKQFEQCRVALERTLKVYVAPEPGALTLAGNLNLLLSQVFLPRTGWEKAVTNNLTRLLHQSRFKDLKEIINDPETFQKFVDLAQDPSLDPRNIREERTAKSKTSLPSESSPVEQLKKELSLSLDTLCERNKDIFELKLKFHTEQLKEAISDSAKHVIQSLSGPYDRLHDKDLRVLWKEMNWIFCVDNKLFTSALFEYYLDHFSSSRYKAKLISDNSAANEDAEERGIVQHTTDENLEKVNVLSSLGILNHPDAWTLELLAKYGERISLAIDRDDSGFIRISEANTFTGRMPTGWNLPQWCAYAAIGWTYEARIYRKRMQKLIDRMFEMQAKVLPANRGFVAISIVDGIVPFYQLLAWEPANDITDEGSEPPDELRELVHEKMKQEDQQYRQKLRSLNWTVEDETILQMLYGKETLETFVLQLSVLQLEYVYEVMQACAKVTIDVKELSHLLAPLHLLRRSCFLRLDELKVQFTKEKQNIDHLENFHGGIWYCLSRARNLGGENVSFADPASLPFEMADVGDFADDEHVLDEFPLHPLPEGQLPYLKYSTWEKHIKTLAPEDTPHRIPDTWHVDDQDSDEEKVSDSRNNWTAFPLAYRECNLCAKCPIAEACFCCTVCHDFDLCSECYIRTREDETLLDHPPSHPLMRFTLHTVFAHREWMMVDAQAQIEELREELNMATWAQHMANDLDAVDDTGSNVDEGENSPVASPTEDFPQHPAYGGESAGAATYGASYGGGSMGQQPPYPGDYGYNNAPIYQDGFPAPGGHPSYQPDYQPDYYNDQNRAYGGAVGHSGAPDYRSSYEPTYGGQNQAYAGVGGHPGGPDFPSYRSGYEPSYGGQDQVYPGVGGHPDNGPNYTPSYERNADSFGDAGRSDDEVSDSGNAADESSYACNHCQKSIPFQQDASITFYKCFRHSCGDYYVCDSCAHLPIIDDDPEGHQWWHSLIVLRRDILIDIYETAPAEAKSEPGTENMYDQGAIITAIGNRLSAVEAKIDATNSMLETSLNTTLGEMINTAVDESNSQLESRISQLEGKVDMMVMELRAFFNTFSLHRGPGY